MLRARQWMTATSVVILLLAGMGLQPRESVQAAICPLVGAHCYAITGWSGSPGTWSGGSTSLLVPAMAFNDPNEVLTNEMWIIDSGGNWIEVGAYVGHPYGNGAQGQMLYFYGQRDANGGWAGDRLATIPGTDLGLWANLFLFNCTFGQQWCLVVQSPTLGSLTTQLPPNTMLANQQHIGAELSNQSGTGNQAFSGEARWANTSYRALNGTYYSQTQFGFFQTVNNPPFAAGWTSAPPGGQWFARTAP